LPRTSPRTAAESHEHLDGLEELGNRIAIPGPGADRTLLFAEIWIKHSELLSLFERLNRVQSNEDCVSVGFSLPKQAVLASAVHVSPLYERLFDPLDLPPFMLP
jgi:hypothetical protein